MIVVNCRYRMRRLAAVLALASALIPTIAMAQLESLAPPDDVKTLPRQPPPASVLAGVAPELAEVLERFLAFKQPPLSKLEPYQARDLLSTGSAVQLILQERGTPAAPVLVDVASAIIKAGPPKGLFVRTYRPMGTHGPLPVTLFYHGGGFVFGALNAYEATPRSLAQKTGAMVVSVAYRLAPEYKFPSAHEDAYAAYIWLRAHAAELGGDAKHVAIVGESAGGNLAIATALMVRDRGATPPDHVVAVYPIARGTFTSPTYKAYGAGVPLSSKMMAWFFRHYLRTPADAANPWIDLIHADLHGLPPTTIFNAEVDPLRSDGEDLTAALQRAGVATKQKTYKGMTHEFFGMEALLPQAREAQRDTADVLIQTFKRP